ncbi:MAG: Hpt domain-containing protein [Alphaproteobacteria bacterium]|nr:Hpt domain-containing protein [Alphaproteobacteria bacterium]MBL7096623.1 Hpt domain-containing protein [Alphaproteobacteria bacterium]
MPPNILKAKVGSVAGGIDMGAIKRAEAAMETLKAEFNDWLADDIARLAMIRGGFANTPTKAMRSELFRAAHDLKGQADTYGYPMVARVASSLANLLDEANVNPVIPLALVDAHVAAIQVAFRDKVNVANDAVAAALAKELEARVIEELAG